MKKILVFLKNDRLVRANTLMVGGSFLGNIGAYLYHLLMGRLLLPGDYGALQSLISLSNIINVPLITFSTVVVKFVSTFMGRGETEAIAYLYRRLKRLFLALLIVGGSAFFLLADPFLNFLHLDSWVGFLFLDIALFFGLLQILNRSMLQGLTKFLHLTITHIIEAFSKLILGVVAVYLGWKFEGAFGAYVLAGAVGYLYSFSVLRRAMPKREKKVPLPDRELMTFAIPSFFMTISLISLYNTDVVLVRHFFSAYESGIYSSLSVLGKIIFFGSAPVALTMFPLVSEAYAKKSGFDRIFLKSFLLTIAIAGGISAIYSLFPKTVLRVFIGVQYLDAARYLMPFSIFIMFCACINLLANFFLSIHKTRVVYVVFLGAGVQALLIALLHTDLSRVIEISLFVVTSLFLVLLLYYGYVTRSKIALRYRASVLARKNNS